MTHNWISPTALEAPWNPNHLVFPTRENPDWLPIGTLPCRFREGIRASSPTFYRLSSFQNFTLVAPHANHTPNPEQPTVAPGDVLLTRLGPIRTAWITQATQRRPVDSNCLCLSGLPPEWGFWLSRILVHPDFPKSFPSPQSRLSIRRLKSIRVPPPPPQVEFLAEHFSRLQADQNEPRLKAEVSRLSPFAKPDDFRPGFYPLDLLDQGWTPQRLSLRLLQEQAKARGWSNLDHLVIHGEQRLAGNEPARPGLCLRDALPPFAFARPNHVAPHSRTYQRPLGPDEVLLSLLGSAPKVVFAHPHPTSQIAVTDTWLRLKPGPFPGALALLLDAPQTRDQLALAITGSRGQRVCRKLLKCIYLPKLPAHLARQWHEDLCTELEREDELRKQKQQLENRIDVLIASALNSPKQEVQE